MKYYISTLILCLFVLGNLSAQDVTYQLSTHILDITLGQPAPNVNVTLEKKVPDTEQWNKIDEKVTDENGRIKDFLPENSTDNTGIYRLTFHTEAYFDRYSIQSFYPFVQVVFQILDNKHYHVPITLSPFGYSTYRGN